MKNEDFLKIVAARADERVQKRITEFKDKILSALRDLSGDTWSCDPRMTTNIDEKPRALLKPFLTADHKKGWPSWLWDREEKKVQEELLATMNEFQRALLAAERKTPGEFEREA